MLRTLPSESVHTVITSPPYWGLRDYGIDGQLGLERCLGDHIAVMVDVFREVRRVLRSDGTLWLNYGDCYAASVNGRSAADTKATGNDDRAFRDKPFSTVGPIYIADAEAGDRRGGACKQRTHDNGTEQHRGRIAAGGFLKPKDLCGVPWRVAFALQEDGWWLRQDIIWSKPNPMPESVTDRCTKAHEYLFMLAKSARYYYDNDAIREPYNQESLSRYDSPMMGCAPQARQPNGDVARREREKGLKQPNPLGRTRRSVWEIATAPFQEAHFATFPPALVEPCILAGSPKGGVVLDPFGGAGTTGLVADRLGRNAILCELNPEYVAIAERRITNDAPLFSDVKRSQAEADADFAGSLEVAYDSIKQRVASGGPKGWAEE